MNCQITKDSIHQRPGWTLCYLLEVEGSAAGFSTVAIAGPWTDRPTVIEFYVVPQVRHHAFSLFGALLTTSNAGHFEVQSNDLLATAVILAHAQDIATESVVFQDMLTTSLLAHGASLRCTTPHEEIIAAIRHRQGGGEWVLEFEGVEAAKGGVLFHYNRPYGDIYMEVNEPFRRRGLGSFLVQELKRCCYELGAIPCARCNPTNVPSRKTLQRAGFVPVAHILNGLLARA